MESKETITLLQGVGVYIGSFKQRDDNYQGVERELLRFAHWFGGDRAFSAIAPPEVGEYAEQLAGTGTTPQAQERLQIIREFLTYSRKKGLIDRSLAQHLRVRKPKARAGRAKVSDGSTAQELTPEGYAQLQAELERLKASRAPLAVQIQKAAADKDVRENVPLEAAREELGHVEFRISSLENTLRAAVILGSSPQPKSPTVRVGTRVRIEDLKTGRKTNYTLVSRSEANPLEGKISVVSPLGKALVGRQAGQEIEVNTPRGKTLYRILEVNA